MGVEKRFDYDSDSILIKEDSYKILGMRKIQDAIESFENGKKEANVMFGLNELINIRRLLILDTIQMDLLRDGIIERADIYKVNKETKL
ncbi:hypothetical protein [Exiguobacterium sp. s133]|uniref:hypothetical protein n=1 Tax=Exiguobacterium sp. s133 TaxID=2751213 RepID=UPI001BE79717|nr:hypothetical protein [Exiguobacterium sp. s133]